MPVDDSLGLHTQGAQPRRNSDTENEVINTNQHGDFILSGVDPGTARQFCETYAPWRMEVIFDEIRTSQFAKYQPFNPHPLGKLDRILKVVPHSDVTGGSVLDIGSNIGYNSLYLASKFGMNSLGIDVTPKLKEIADKISSMTNVKATFILESAEDFLRPNAFDLVLHLGTLYHLPNPHRSIQRCVESLKVGGWFALETMCYRGSEDPFLCKWIWGFNGDKTNFWSLGESAIKSIVARLGIPDLKLILEVKPEAYNGEHSRTLWVGKKT